VAAVWMDEYKALYYDRLGRTAATQEQLSSAYLQSLDLDKTIFCQLFNRTRPFPIAKWQRSCLPHHIDADPDPSLHFNEHPDMTFLSLLCESKNGS
jgi:hypothetical protein